eukprot:TRINITY_DN16950_c0_g1_i10.p1 TRINITY_DN16950_c0_g1~~TRINITY_DN16950_c0_g1_i10.p1  ORF type:complete len:148 (-),score=13.49 TRINITY_DN16950_c0_g1_i10:41-484(-)
MGAILSLSLYIYIIEKSGIHITFRSKKEPKSQPDSITDLNSYRTEPLKLVSLCLGKCRKEKLNTIFHSFVDPKTNLTMVNMHKFKGNSKEGGERLIFASQASQVFYSKDQNKAWMVCFSNGPKKIVKKCRRLKILLCFLPLLKKMPI